MTNLGTALPPVPPKTANWRLIGGTALAGTALLAGLYLGWTAYNTGADIDATVKAADSAVEYAVSVGQRMPSLAFADEPKPEPQHQDKEPVLWEEPAQQATMAKLKTKLAGMTSASSVSTRNDAAGVAQTIGDQLPTVRSPSDPHSQFLETASLGSPKARLTPQQTGLFIKRSTIIQATMLNAVNSDLPGDAAAMVNQDVLDSTLRYVLIRAGSTLYGKYNPQVGYGQTRNQIVWLTIDIPNVGELDLGGMPATDASGAAGVRGYVDRHYPQLAGAVLGSAFFTVLGQAGTILRGDGGDTNIGVIGAGAAGNEASSIGGELMRRELNRPNTLGLKQGDPVAVMLRENVRLPVVR